MSRKRDLEVALQTLIDAFSGLVEHIDDIASGDQSGDDDPRAIGETPIRELPKIHLHADNVTAAAERVLKPGPARSEVGRSGGIFEYDERGKIRAFILPSDPGDE